MALVEAPLQLMIATYFQFNYIDICRELRQQDILPSNNGNTQSAGFIKSAANLKQHELTL